MAPIFVYPHIEGTLSGALATNRKHAMGGKESDNSIIMLHTLYLYMQCSIRVLGLRQTPPLEPVFHLLLYPYITIR